jgi:hypothetical protein
VRDAMNDFACLFFAVGFFALSAAYAWFCGRLR